jgi:excisionase family DNA binding protein
MEGEHMTANTSAETITEKRCYTVDELQAILCVSRPTVYTLLKRKEFRWFQIGGGKYRISKKSFDEWLDQQC